MSSNLYVFDFDKTLTYNDTILGFYYELNKRNNTILKIIKRVILLKASILYKLKIISNDTLKIVGVRLFLKGLKKNEIEKVADAYSKLITLNKIYYEIFINTPKKQRIISSASFEVYLKYVFPDENVIGTTLNYKQGQVDSLKTNNYGTEKVNSIDKIFTLYTDSFSDKPLMDISKNVYMVKDDTIKKIK